MDDNIVDNNNKNTIDNVIDYNEVSNVFEENIVDNNISFTDKPFKKII